MLIGALLFALDAWRNEPVPAVEDAVSDDVRILVTTTIRDELHAAFVREIGREPVEDELEVLVDEWVAQEALVLEAQALGLHDNDPIIRRRLEQNMRFLLEDADAIDPVGTSAVDAWIAENLPDPARRARLDIEHVYLSGDRHGDAAQAAAASQRDALQGGAAAVGRGDPFVRGRQFTNVGVNEMTRVFGEGFAESVLALEPQGWSDPVESPYGFHVVRVIDRRVPPAEGTDAERDAGRRAIERERRAALNERAVRELVERYEVRREDG